MHKLSIRAAVNSKPRLVIGECSCGDWSIDKRGTNVSKIKKGIRSLHKYHVFLRS